MDTNNTIDENMEREITENDRKRCRLEEHLEPNVKLEQHFDKIMKMKVQCDLVILELKNKIEMLEEENKKLQCIMEKEQLNYQQLKLKYQQVLMVEESNLDKNKSITNLMTVFLEQIKNIKNYYKLNQKNQYAAREYMEKVDKLIDKMKSSQQAREAEYSDKVTTLQERLEDKQALITELNDKVVCLKINLTVLEDKVKELQDMLDNVQSTNTVLNAHKEALKEEVAMWMQKCDQLKEESNQTMRQLNANLQELGRQYQAKCDELEKLSNELENVNELKTKLTYETDNLKEELRDKENHYIEQKSIYEAKLNDFENEVKELREDHETTRVELESQQAALQQQLEMLENENKNLKQEKLAFENQLTDSVEEMKRVITDKENLQLSIKKLQQNYENEQIKHEEERENLNQVHSERIRRSEAKQSEYENKIKELENQILIKDEEYKHIEHNCKMLLSGSTNKPKAIMKKSYLKDAKVVASPLVGSSSMDYQANNYEEIKKNYFWPAIRTSKTNGQKNTGSFFESDSDDTDTLSLNNTNLNKKLEEVMREQKSATKKYITTYQK